MLRHPGDQKIRPCTGQCQIDTSLDRAIASIANRFRLMLRHPFSGSGDKKSTLVCRPKLDLGPIRPNGQASPSRSMGSKSSLERRFAFMRLPCVPGAEQSYVKRFRSGTEARPPLIGEAAPREWASVSRANGNRARHTIPIGADSHREGVREHGHTAPERINISP
jgi:hypothetical protein